MQPPHERVDGRVGRCAFPPDHESLGHKECLADGLEARTLERRARRNNVGDRIGYAQGHRIFDCAVEPDNPGLDPLLRQPGIEQPRVRGRDALARKVLRHAHHAFRRREPKTRRGKAKLEDLARASA